MPDLRLAVGTVLDWPVDHVAAAVITGDGAVAATAGETDRVFGRLASVTKLLTAYAALIAVRGGRGRVGHPGRAARRHRAPPRRARLGARVRRGHQVQAEPGGPADLLERRVRACSARPSPKATGIPFAEYLREARAASRWA